LDAADDALNQLARENRRLYNDIQQLPVPRKLSSEDKAKSNSSREQVSLTSIAQNRSKRNAKHVDKQTLNSVRTSKLYITTLARVRKLYRDEMAPLALLRLQCQNRLILYLIHHTAALHASDVMVAAPRTASEPLDEEKFNTCAILKPNGGYSMWLPRCQTQ